MLIALAIVAMSVGALLGTVTSSASNVIYLKDKTLAEWVALNRLTEVRIDKNMPDKGKRKGNAVMGGMRWEWEEEVTELPVEGMLRVDVRAHATGEAVDDSRPVEKPTTQKLTPSSPSGASLDKASWTTTVTGVVSTARSDLMQPAPHLRRAIRRTTSGRQPEGRAGQQSRVHRMRPALPALPALPAHQAARPSTRPNLRRRIADAPSRLHTHRGGDRDVHRGDHVRDRVWRDQPGAASIAMRSMSRRRASPKFSVACAWSPRTSRR